MVENAFEILVSRFRVLLGTMGQRPRVVRDIVFTCVVLHNMLRTHQGRAYRAPTSANDVVALQNEQVVNMPDDNYRNPLRETKYQRDLLKDCFNTVGALVGQEDRISDGSYPGGRQVFHLYQSFLGLPNYSKNYYLSWCC